MIVDESDAYRIERNDLGDTLVVTGWWTPDISRRLADGTVDGLDLNYAKGFKDVDLGWFDDWPLRRLTVLARTVKDVSPILRVASTLESVSLEVAPAAKVYLAVFPKLESVSAPWAQICASVAEAPALRHVSARAYDQPDLAPFRWNTSLVSIQMKDRPRLKRLDGVQSLRLLERLGIYLAPLSDISALMTDRVALRELQVEACPVGDLSALETQGNLEFLNASDCGNLFSLHPLGTLVKLSTVWLFGSTRVVDDDLSPLCALPRLRELRMRSRRSYRPPVEAVQALCRAR